MASSTTTARQAPTPNFLFPRNSPLRGVSGIIVFVAPGITGGIVDLCVCWRLLNLSDPTKIAIAVIFVLLLAVGWISFCLAFDLGSFIIYGAIILGLYGPVAGMLTTNLGILFWLSLIAVIAQGVITVLNEVQTATPWSKVLVSIYASWVLAGIVVTLGSSRLFGYAQSSSTLAELHVLLDARYLITAVLLLSAFGDAMVKAFEAGLPKIPAPPRIRFLDLDQLPDSGMAVVIRPFLVFTNAFLMMAQLLVNLVWQLVGFIVAYLSRTGKNLAHQLHALVTNRTLLREIGRLVLSFISAVVFTKVVSAVAPDVVVYLASSTSPFSLSGKIVGVMFRIFLLAVVTVATVLLSTWLWETTMSLFGTRMNGIDQVAFGGAVILVALSLSSGIIYLLAKFHLLDIVGFDSIGIFTLLLFLMVGSVAVYYIALLATSGAKNPRS